MFPYPARFLLRYLLLLPFFPLLQHEVLCDNHEVKSTKASRDSGIDTIVYDSDPIRGGKFVIQSKRYNAVNR